MEAFLDNTPDTATSVMTLAPVTRTQINVFSDQVIADVKEGRIDPLYVRALIKGFNEALDRINKETQQEQLNAADKYPGKVFEAHGVAFTKGATFTKYDYESCGDTLWEMADSGIKSYENQRKEREEFLRKLPGPMADPDTGEIISPPKKKETQGLKVSIK